MSVPPTAWQACWPSAESSASWSSGPTQAILLVNQTAFRRFILTGHFC